MRYKDMDRKLEGGSVDEKKEGAQPVGRWTETLVVREVPCMSTQCRRGAKAVSAAFATIEAAQRRRTLVAVDTVGLGLGLGH
jgi:hypothetical protein